MMELQIPMMDPRRLTRALVAVIIFLVLGSSVVQFVYLTYGYSHQVGLRPFLYVDMESNLPTWYSSITLFFAAVLLAMIALVKWRQEDRFRRHWAFLSILFVLLSLDEVAMIHELPILPLRERLAAGGLLYYAWVIPGMLFVAAVGLGMLKFLWKLPRRTRNFFLVAGGVFVGGAIGVEMISGLQADLHGVFNFGYLVIITVEESMEMLGVVIFIHGLIDYLRTQVREVRISLAAPDQAPSESN